MARLNNEILLTISIPTFNRAGFLKRALDYIYDQIADLGYRIEIIVSDNASIDNTADVVKEFQDKGLPINYIRNAKNLGPDRNIGQCYTLATGKYVLVLGDDDVLLPGSLNFFEPYLIDDYGLIHLNYYGFKKDPIAEIPKRNFFEGAYKYTDGNIIKKIRSKLTFTSANMVNTKYIDSASIEQAMHTNLNQLPGVINAIISSKNNLFIGKYLLAQQVENSGGYNYLKVFGQNIAELTNSLLTGNENKRYKRWIFNELIISIFPPAILRAKIVSKEELQINFALLKKYYKSYFLFWLFNYPIVVLPVTAAKLFVVGTKVYRELFYFVNALHWKKNLNK